MLTSLPKSKDRHSKTALLLAIPLVYYSLKNNTARTHARMHTHTHTHTHTKQNKQKQNKKTNDKTQDKIKQNKTRQNKTHRTHAHKKWERKRKPPIKRKYSWNSILTHLLHGLPVVGAGFCTDTLHTQCRACLINSFHTDWNVAEMNPRSVSREWQPLLHCNKMSLARC